MSFNDMRISAKLAIGFTTVVAFSIVVGLVGISKIKVIDAADTKLYEKGAVPLGLMVDLATEFQRCRINIRDMIFSSDPKEAERYKATNLELRKEMDKEIVDVEKTIMTDEGKRAFAQLQKNKEAVYKDWDAIIALDSAGKDKEAIAFLRGEALQSNKEFTADLDALVKSKKEASATISDENTKTANAATFLMITLLTAGSLFAAGFAFFIARQISGALSGVSAKLQESSNQVASAAAQVSSASQQLAGTSTEQASAVEETSASLEEMSGMVENTVRYSESGLALVEGVKTASAQGNQSMESLATAMAQVMESNKRIEQLVKVIGEIGEKTEIIDEIVFQTKLLSFNASVEAERAGEHGRGFAVVAQEVGNLAQMSGKAALEISSIVKSSTKEAEEIASENKARVEKGNEYVHETGEFLKQIEKSAESVLNGSRQILSASKEQAAGIKQITAAMDNINKATQETSATSEESASAGEELNAQAQHLKNFVGDLNTIILGKGNGVTETRPLAEAPHTRRSENVVSMEQARKFKRQGPAAKSGKVTSEGVRFKKAVGDPSEHATEEVASATGNNAWDKL